MSGIDLFQGSHLQPFRPDVLSKDFMNQTRFFRSTVVFRFKHVRFKQDFLFKQDFTDLKMKECAKQCLV